MKKLESIKAVLDDYAANTKLVCLDEFQVTDIADAMILRRVLEGLAEHEILLVTTSNRRPDDLYLNGIQRSSFLPCIDHIKTNMQVINLSSASDYRTVNSDDALKETFLNFTHLFPEAKELDLHILGRAIRIPRGVLGQACQFTFRELFEAPFSAADYMEICRNFPQVFITAIPELDDSMRNELRRLITFVDICYERDVRIHFDSSILSKLHRVQSQLNETHDESFALNRTVSRLTEMQNWK